ncbi:hypothetical protein CPB83DRAFT_900988 [Crepidotus variabilis]|uniref:Uncharacterized protein n=1 Tax=Crepidotus variabilis TaxID=179855 RepID=A0A9P6BBB5_9AGAR|nr:hypothetical protein CPB83DRAFT_900988 [Crepidotus variabilis]
MSDIPLQASGILLSGHLPSIDLSGLPSPQPVTQSHLKLLWNEIDRIQAHLYTLSDEVNADGQRTHHVLRRLQRLQDKFNEQTDLTQDQNDTILQVEATLRCIQDSTSRWISEASSEIKSTVLQDVTNALHGVDIQLEDLYTRLSTGVFQQSVPTVVNQKCTQQEIPHSQDGPELQNLHQSVFDLQDSMLVLQNNMDRKLGILQFVQIEK